MSQTFSMTRSISPAEKLPDPRGPRRAARCEGQHTRGAARRVEWVAAAAASRRAPFGRSRRHEPAPPPSPAGPVPRLGESGPDHRSVQGDGRGSGGVEQSLRWPPAGLEEQRRKGEPRARRRWRRGRGGQRDGGIELRAGSAARDARPLLAALPLDERFAADEESFASKASVEMRLTGAELVGHLGVPNTFRCAVCDAFERVALMTGRYEGVLVNT